MSSAKLTWTLTIKRRDSDNNHTETFGNEKMAYDAFDSVCKDRAITRANLSLTVTIEGLATHSKS
jgi:hypothetical protein